MGKFSKIKKYSKPSLDINEKIENLNKEMLKVGMLSEKMTTSTVYPDTETQPYIPPTYDFVPDSSGITGDSFVQPVNGGDENDSDTWENGWNTNEYLFNPDELDGVSNRAIVSHVPNSPYGDGGGGIVITGRYFGRSVGYLDGGNVYRQVLVGALGSVNGTEQPTEASRGFGGTYRGLSDEEFNFAVSFWNKYQSLINEYGIFNIPTITVKAWVAYNRFHDFQRGGEFETWTGGPKGSKGILDNFAVVNVRSTDKYVSDPGQPRTAVLNRMDDPNSDHYHPGPIESAIFSSLGVGRRGFEYLRNKSKRVAGYGLLPDGTMGFSKPGDKIKGTDGKIYQLVPRPGYGYNQWIPVKQAQADQDTQIAGGIYPSNKYDPVKSAPYIQDPKIYGGSGTRSGSGNTWDSNDPSTWPSIKNQLKQAKRKQSGAVVAHFEPQGQVISEGWQSPKHTNIESDERKRWFNPSDIAPLYPEKEPNTGIYTPSVESEEPPVTKKKEPHIKITEKDLIKNYRLKDSEVEEMMDTINALNAFLDAHPEELIHAQKRYPKGDPRLAELNWKMDQMLGASEEYMNTHFPENTRLFNRVQKSIKRSIRLTDPRTYKDSKLPNTYYKLLSADYVSGYGVEKKVLKLGSKNKKSPARFLKKPRLKTKSEIVQEKLSQLQDDLKKFGIGT